MKVRFTQFLFCLLSLVFASDIQAQVVNAVRVDSPMDIAGEYGITMSDGWGAQQTTEFSGAATFVNDGTDPVTDGCETTISNITGKIAFIDRGDCEFGVKALNAENAGATVAIICNNVTDPITIGPGEVGDQVSIPVGIMTLVDCQTIRAFAETEDIQITLTFADCLDPTYAPNVFYTEDFAGGLGDWVVAAEGNASWVYSEDEALFQAGSFAGAVVIDMPTSCNGFVGFDSDFYDNSGACPAPCAGSLISPTVDLTTVEDLAGVYLEFDQFTRNFGSGYQVMFSKNGGVTWPDTVTINQNLITNGPSSNNTLRVPASGYESANSITVQIRYASNYYYWAIDNIRLINELSSDMNLRENFVAVQPTFRTPLSQATPIPFLIDIENLGNLDAEDVEVAVEVFNEAGDMVFTTTNTNYATQTGGVFLNENSAFAETFTPTEVGAYSGRYVISTSSNEVDFSNNQFDFFFEVTDDLLSPMLPEADFNGPLGGIFDGLIFDDPNNANFIPNYATGHIFYAPNGEGHLLNEVRFGINDLPVGTAANIDVYLFKWLYSDQDNSANFAMTPQNSQLIGVNNQTILTFGGLVRIGQTQAADTRFLEIPMSASDQSGLPLTDGNGDFIPLELENETNYALVIACRSGDDLPLNLIGVDPEANDQLRSFDPSASNLAFDSLGVDIVTGGFLQPITANDGPESFQNFSIDDSFFGSGFNSNILWVEMQIQPRSVSTEDLNLTQNIEVYPNPASDHIYIDIDLDETSKNVTVDFVNTKGERVITERFSNVINRRLEIATTQLPSGFYNVNIRTEEGLSSKKILIQK